MTEKDTIRFLARDVSQLRPFLGPVDRTGLVATRLRENV